MKVRVQRVVALVVGLLVVATGLFSLATPAYARGENFTFYYKAEDVDAIKASIPVVQGTGGVFSNGADKFPQTSINLKDGLFNSVIRLNYDGQKSQLRKKPTYSMTYSCAAGNVISYPAKELDRYTLTLDVVLDIGADFNSKNSFTGQSLLSTTKNGPGTTGEAPASCRVTEGTLNSISNFTKLNATQKASWPNLKTTVEATAPGAGTDPDNDPNNQDEDTCTAPGGFGWIVCSMIEYTEAMVTWIETKVIEPFLQPEPLSFDTGPDNPLYGAWNTIRGLANIFFALIFFGIIFANVFGVQAYNVKKMLPRLIVAAILVQLSYVLVALAYDISGVLSGGLRSLLDPYVPALNFNGATPIGSAVTVGASALLAVAVASHVASVGLIAAVLPLGFGMLSTLFTLALLDVARVFFVLTAAPGFAAMVLPGTQPTFKKWMNGLILVLMMPVIIVLLFMVGKFAAFAAAAGGGDLGPFIALLCLALSLLAAPFSFTFAKGTIGQLTKLADSRVKGVGKGIGSSQLLQNRAQNRQDKAAMNYANPRFGVASRLRSRAQTGQLWSGSVGQQRLAGSYNKIVNDRQKALNQQFTNLNPADQKSVLTSLANGNGAKDAAGKRVGGFKNDAATQVAALQRLMQDRQYDALRDKVGASVKSSQAWRTATQSHMGDLFKEAPDLVAPGGIASVATATPAALGDMHSSTLERAMKDTTVAPQMLPSLQQLSGNAGLRNKIKSTDAAKLWENAGNFKGQKVWVKDTTAPGGKKEVEGDVFIRDHLLQVDAGAKDAAGNWTSATSARIKDATA